MSLPVELPHQARFVDGLTVRAGCTAWSYSRPVLVLASCSCKGEANTDVTTFADKK
jgi:hypothetical protein